MFSNVLFQSNTVSNASQRPFLLGSGHVSVGECVSLKVSTFNCIGILVAVLLCITVSTVRCSVNFSRLCPSKVINNEKLHYVLLYCVVEIHSIKFELFVR